MVSKVGLLTLATDLSPLVTSFEHSISASSRVVSEECAKRIEAVGRLTHNGMIG